ncbi:MAG TPA: hypothetical protein VNV41_06205 [Candidatus Acidoferrales bacterium]|jgi:hypothetical protein|nr:hypothetical protein [Candidatus Acidoferrales bacterium]
MPDWNALVREYLGAAEPISVEEADVIAELSGHLEDLYGELRGKGMCESDAMGQALGDMSDWRGLLKRIRRAKGREGTLNHRTKTLWLPGLVSLTGSMGWLAILQHLNLRPHMPWLHSGLPVVPYLVWLITQPLFGAIGTYLSRRAGGERLAEFAASLSPSIVMLGLWCFVLAMSVLVEKNVHVLQQWPSIFVGALILAIFPALSLLLGRLLFLRIDRQRPQAG